MVTKMGLGLFRHGDVCGETFTYERKKFGGHKSPAKTAVPAHHNPHVRARISRGQSIELDWSLNYTVKQL